MKKKLLTLISIIAFAFTLSAQNVTIPDANFKAYLLANNAINTDADKLNISFTEAVAFKGKLNVSYRNIVSLVGIEAFINLTYLDCGYTKITSIDVTKNTALTDLHCYNNQLTSLDVTKNTALTGLYSSFNKITSLDITNNMALKRLDCYKNQITSLDLTKNTALTKLLCGYNQLTNIDVTKCTALTYLDCYSNKLINLDLTKNIGLIKLGTNFNSNLSCIQALNSQDKTNWTKDNTAEYNENCNYTVGLNDETIIQPKSIVHIYNIQGQEVSKSYTGLVIYKYTDGTSEKVVQ
jgi:hypothetical protein